MWNLHLAEHKYNSIFIAPLAQYALNLGILTKFVIFCSLLQNLCHFHSVQEANRLVCDKSF